MTTIDTLMALALNYRLAGSASSDEHESTLRTALTEALTQPIDTSPEGVEKSGGNVQMQPVALNWRELVAWWESGAEQWDGLRDIVQKMIQAAQPVRGQSCETCKHCTVASQQSFEETCLVCSQNYYNKYEAKK